jgi:hypothetical protein
MTNKDLVEAAREYAKHDDYSVTRNYINALCAEIDRLRTLNKDVFGRIQDNTEVYKDAERYRWLRSCAWDVPFNAYAPAVVICNTDMSKWEWLIDRELDSAVDKAMKDEQ